MLQYIKATGSVRVDGALVLRVTELAQRDDGQWFKRVKDQRSTGWLACSVELVHEVQRRFWVVLIDGKSFGDGPVALLPASCWPSLRLPK